MLMHLIATALGQKDVTPETFMVSRIFGGAPAAEEPEEPDVHEDGTVSKSTIAALAKMLGAEPPPWAKPEPDVHEDGTVSRATIAELSKQLGAKPPP